VRETKREKDQSEREYSEFCVYSSVGVAGVKGKPAACSAVLLRVGWWWVVVVVLLGVLPPLCWNRAASSARLNSPTLEADSDGDRSHPLPIFHGEVGVSGADGGAAAPI